MSDTIVSWAAWRDTPLLEVWWLICRASQSNFLPPTPSVTLFFPPWLPLFSLFSPGNSHSFFGCISSCTALRHFISSHHPRQQCAYRYRKRWKCMEYVSLCLEPVKQAKKNANRCGLDVIIPIQAAEGIRRLLCFGPFSLMCKSCAVWFD